MDVNKDMDTIKFPDMSKEEALMMVINTMKKKCKTQNIIDSCYN